VSNRLQEVVAHLPASDRRQFERIATSIVVAASVRAVFGGAAEPASRASRA
jgi:hypothetical protein